ncbi:metallophosphoesterase family protein [Piscinibacter sp. XHJ-5]|uniref:metallophosphoesterase family protein n=1 Tax=Piscinibacter sp. XHJ-5 TaxID=3037797 RepID=UPI0024535D98|nr:metallophosphoesterase family protein [Piscinibacter sp. XHJ-5]
MKIAVVSDIHGNLAALDAVLADIDEAGADVTVNLGDILSGPLWVAETAERLMALELPTIAGNHERQLLELPRERMGASDAHAAAQLDDRRRAWLAWLPKTLRLTDEVLCCHGTPTHDLVYFLETVVAQPDGPGIRAATPAEARERAGTAMAGVPHAVILCGHSHVPRVLRLADGRLIVNPGSVGLQAYDDGPAHPHVVENGSPHARYAMLRRREAGWQVELRSVPYDAEAAARLAESNHRPDWADALRTGFVGRRAGVA